MLRLHCFAQSGHAYKVALMLTLCDLAWEPVFVDFFSGATRGEAFRSTLNEMGEVPVLEIEGERLTQSGVILHRLARMTGRFRPSEAQAEDAWRWILFDNHKFTSYLATYRFLRSFAPNPDPAVLAFFKGRVDSAFAIVEKHLAAQPFLLGAEPTIADLSLAGYVFYPAEETGYDFASSHPAIETWRNRIRALSGWAHPYDLMPGTVPPR